MNQFDIAITRIEVPEAEVFNREVYATGVMFGATGEVFTVGCEPIRRLKRGRPFEGRKMIAKGIQLKPGHKLVGRVQLFEDDRDFRELQSKVEALRKGLEIGFKVAKAASIYSVPDAAKRILDTAFDAAEDALERQADDFLAELSFYTSKPAGSYRMDGPKVRAELRVSESGAS